MALVNSRRLKYPSDPSASMIESLYDQDDKPEKLDGQMCQSLEVLPLRKSSKLYDRGSGSGSHQNQGDMQLAKVRPSAPASRPMGNMQPQMMEMFQMFQMFQQMQRVMNQGAAVAAVSRRLKRDWQVFRSLVTGKARSVNLPLLPAPQGLIKIHLFQQASSNIVTVKRR